MKTKKTKQLQGRRLAGEGEVYLVRPIQKKSISQIFNVMESSGKSERRFKVEEQYRQGAGYLRADEEIPVAEQAEVRCAINTDYLETKLEDCDGFKFEFDECWSPAEIAKIRQGWSGEGDGDAFSEGWALEGGHEFNFEIEDAYVLISGEFEVDIVNEKSGAVVAKKVVRVVR